MDEAVTSHRIRAVVFARDTVADAEKLDYLTRRLAQKDQEIARLTAKLHTIENYAQALIHYTKQ